MPQSLARMLGHLVFSTKHRQPLLADAWRDDLHAYIGGIARDLDGGVVCAGSVADHIHLLVQMPRTETIATLVGEIKTGSGRWIRERQPASADFHWQAGYGIFSVGITNQEAVERYIATQAEHHRTVSFQEEFRSFCERHGLRLDERYAWD